MMKSTQLQKRLCNPIPQFRKVFLKTFSCFLVLKCFCDSSPKLVGLATMSGMVWVVHSPDVVSHKVLDVLLASVVDADMVTAVKDIESVEVSRIGFVNIELHNVFFCFLVKMCFSSLS
jgi:hypothetical protein